MGARACELDPDAGWNLLERARTIHCANVQLLLDAKRDEPSYDELSSTCGFNWTKQEVLMYIDKQLQRFRNLKQVCTVADPGTHCGQETLVAIVLMVS